MIRDNQGFSERLKEAIGNEKVAAFARRAGIQDSTMRSYLAGTLPCIDKANKIAQICGVSVEWLVTGEAQPTGTGQLLATVSQRIRASAEIIGGMTALHIKTGIPLRTLSNYVAGRNDIPSVNLLKISTATGLPISWFYDDFLPSNPVKKTEVSPSFQFPAQGVNGRPPAARGGQTAEVIPPSPRKDDGPSAVCTYSPRQWVHTAWMCAFFFLNAFGLTVIWAATEARVTACAIDNAESLHGVRP